MIYVYLALGLIVFGVGGYELNAYGNYRVGKAEQKVAAAQKVADDATAARVQDADNKIDDMMAAREVALQEGAAAQRAREVKGAANVASNAVFTNPVCTMPAQAMDDYNDVLRSITGRLLDDPGPRSLHPTTDASGPHAPLPGPASAVGPVVRGVVPERNPKFRPLGSAVRPAGQ